MDLEFITIERTQSGWQALFQKLYQIAKANAGSQLIAKKPMNVIRNRYRDVLPIDSTRVVLNDPDSDYINANFVKVKEVERQYILCQGPLQHTAPHLWQMVWEQNTAGVIMLNKCVERGMNKCYPYWPQPDDPPIDFGKFLVENVGYEDGLSYRLTRLKLTKVEEEESREVLHFHYTRWPDFGVPQNPEVFLDYLYAVRASGVLDSDKGPAVVHCSAGIGRSGTFCIVDALLAKLEKTRDIASVDLQSTLLDMRRQRLGLVQTADQLRFSYIAILQGALQDLEIEPTKGLLDDEKEEEVEEDEDEEEDEVETEESEEDDDEDDDDEDTEERLNRKYPHLNRPASSSNIPVVDADDVPPPLPPRPIETLQPQSEESSEDEVQDSEEDEEEDEEEEEETGIPPDDGASPPLTSERPTPPPPTSPPPPSNSSQPPPPPPDSASSSPSKKIKLTPNISFSDDDILDFKVSEPVPLPPSPPVNNNTEENADDILDFKVSAPVPSPPANSNGKENAISTQDEHRVLENGELEELGEEEEAAGTAEPPPIPPRNYSLSPGPGGSYLRDYLKDDDTGKAEIFNSDLAFLNSNASPFLLEGRGGERAQPPPLPKMTNGISAAANEDDNTEETPPPIPAKAGRKKSGNRLEEITEEEKALVGELDLLEKLMESQQERKLEASATCVETKTAEEQLLEDDVEDEVLAKGEERRRLREERRSRLEDKVQGIKANMRKNEQGYDSDWSIPWLLVGFVVMLGYCAYYIIH